MDVGVGDAGVEILKSGLLGAMFIFVTVPLGLYVRAQSKQIREITQKWADAEAARAKDAQSVIDKILGLNDKWNALISDQTSVVNTLEATLRENKEALREVRDALNRLRGP